MLRHNFCHDKTERLRQKIQRLQTKLDEKLAEHWTESDATTSSDAELVSEIASVSLGPDGTSQCGTKCCATVPPTAPQEQSSNASAEPVASPPTVQQQEPQVSDDLRQIHDMNVALLYTKFADKKDSIKRKLENIEQKASAKADNPEAQARFAKKREKLNAKLTKLDQQLQKKLAFVDRMAHRRRWCVQKHQQHAGAPRKCFQRAGFLEMKIQQLRLKRDYIDNRIKLLEDRRAAITNDQHEPGFHYQRQQRCQAERDFPRFEGEHRRHGFGPKCHRFQNHGHYGHHGGHHHGGHHHGHHGFKTITIVKSNE